MSVSQGLRGLAAVDVLDWIEESLSPIPCSSVKFMYDDMGSQSDYGLPVIYQPFDAHQRSHWRDRGSLFDYLYSTGAGKLLDFGPGDGWPSLIVAPYAEEIVGVDASRRRVAVCAANATRLGLSNVRFVHAGPGAQLPFPDDHFDGVMAASSLEQTPDPRMTLREFLRVLRPGGRLRVGYEALGRYRDGDEQDAWLWHVGGRTSLMLVHRDIDGERARQYRLIFSLPSEEVEAFLLQQEGSLSPEGVSVRALEALSPFVVQALSCSLIHPSGHTLASWLREAGFRDVFPTHSGAFFAGRLFEEIPVARRPTTIGDVDDLLRPAVRAVVQMAAPLDEDPMITAVK